MISALRNHGKRAVTSRRRIDAVVRRVFSPKVVDALEDRVETPRRWQKTLRFLLPFGGASEGNRIAAFHDGPSAFRAKFASIDGAQRRVWLEIYTLEPDATGRLMLAKLTEAAKRGVHVTLLYDDIGSFNISSADLQPLRDAGATVVTFNPIVQWSSWSRKWFRTHRKILLVDDHAYMGSMNIADSYAGAAAAEASALGFSEARRFRDTHMRVDGPAVKHLSEVFVNSLRETDPALAATPEYLYTAPQPYPDGMFVQVMQSNTFRNIWHIPRAMRVALRGARQRCYIATPYFLPPKGLRDALIDAARRGVDVRVLTAGHTDVKSSQWASKHVYGQYLRAGVRIHELYGGMFLHAKTMTIDGIYTSVGSYNLDELSAKLNLEVTMSMLDVRLAKGFERRFLVDIEQAHEVTLRAWRARPIAQKLLHAIYYYTSRVGLWSFSPPNNKHSMI